MKLESFRARISSVRDASGPRASYHNISLSGGFVRFTRESTGNEESISVQELYDLYRSEEFIDTTIARDYITGRVYSPSVAILKAAGLVDSNGNRTGFVKSDEQPLIKSGDRIRHVITSSKKKPEKPKAEKSNDETIFFKALNTYLGPNRLYAKNIGYSISSSEVYLSDDYSKYRFTTKNTEPLFHGILEALNGTNNFNNKSLSHHVDGLIHDHPKLGYRIAEFDEEQHFTPARKDTLLTLSKSMSIPYADRYIKICNDIDYLNDQVLKKHRIKPKLKVAPDNFLDFISWLDEAQVSDSGYIAPKPAFNYKGGRIAQRAYYDSLRDTAHLSEFNKRHKLKAPLRFAKYTFEKKYGRPFSHLSQEEIVKGIMEIMKQDYGL